MDLLPKYRIAKLLKSGLGRPMRMLKADDCRAAATARYLENKSDLCMELTRSIDFMSE